MARYKTLEVQANTATKVDEKLMCLGIKKLLKTLE